MKVILLEDVYKQGVAGEVVNVAPGYARNYLIPKRLAVKVTPGALKQSETLRQHVEVRRAEKGEKFSKIAEQVEGLTLYFGVKASETGKLYGSVTPVEITERLEEEIGLEIDRRRVGDRPLRELGEHMVPVRLDAGLAPAVRVIVFREGADPRLVVEEEAEEAEEGEGLAEDVLLEGALPEDALADEAEAVGAELAEEPAEEPVEELQPAAEAEPEGEAHEADEAVEEEA
jgi:large subunit ribosomal protein L9